MSRVRDVAGGPNRPNSVVLNGKNNSRINWSKEVDGYILPNKNKNKPPVYYEIVVVYYCPHEWIPKEYVTAATCKAEAMAAFFASREKDEQIPMVLGFEVGGVIEMNPPTEEEEQEKNEKEKSGLARLREAILGN